MEFVFAARFLAACAVVAAVLAVLHVAVRFGLRSWPQRRGGGRLLGVIETTFLPSAASLHVVRVADRYFMIGRSGGHIATLAEIAPETVAGRHATFGRRPAPRP